MNEFIKAEKTRISGMLASYTKQVDDITNEMLGIDAKYKALAKKEKEALSASLSVLKDLIKGASKMYAMLDADTEEKMEEKMGEKVEEKVTAPVIPDENEQVVDSLFPENNVAPANDDKIEDEGPESDDAGYTEDDDIPAEEEKELDLAGMKQDNTVLDFEKEVEDEEEEDDEDAVPEAEWDKISQW